MLKVEGRATNISVKVRLQLRENGLGTFLVLGPRAWDVLHGGGEHRNLNFWHT